MIIRYSSVERSIPRLSFCAWHGARSFEKRLQEWTRSFPGRGWNDHLWGLIYVSPVRQLACIELKPVCWNAGQRSDLHELHPCTGIPNRPSLMGICFFMRCLDTNVCIKTVLPAGSSGPAKEKERLLIIHPACKIRSIHTCCISAYSSWDGCGNRELLWVHEQVNHPLPTETGNGDTHSNTYGMRTLHLLCCRWWERA